jgi:hypothetical protein
MLFLRNQLRPIARLARAAEAFGRGERLPYRPRGALEVRAAGRAFLEMRGRIERQIEQRMLMLSGVSHDLRTPLTRMRLGLAFLPEEEETRALLADVAQMERMVDAFLAFVRSDATEGEEPADLTALVAEAVADARRGGGAVTLRAPQGGPRPVHLRPQAVRRALDNLIGNALRHGTRVEVGIVWREESLCLTVEDDGPGIPEEAREEAVKPFARLGAARDPNRGGGVGLGLAIATDIALSHGGSLRLLDSARLGGLRVDLTLARYPRGPEASAQPAPGGSGRADPGRSARARGPGAGGAAGPPQRGRARISTQAGRLRRSGQARPRSRGVQQIGAVRGRVPSRRHHPLGRSLTKPRPVFSAAVHQRIAAAVQPLAQFRAIACRHGRCRRGRHCRRQGPVRPRPAGPRPAARRARPRAAAH